MVFLLNNMTRVGITLLFLLLHFAVYGTDFEAFQSTLNDKETETAKLNYVQTIEPEVSSWSTTDQGRFYHQKGLILEINDQIDQAKSSFTDSIEIFATAGEPNGYWVKSLLDRSYMDYLLTNDAQVYCADRQEAVEIARKTDQSDALVGSLVQLAFCYQDSFEDFKKGLAILDEAATISQHKNLAATMTAMIHNATGNLYRSKQVHDKAYEYYSKAYDSWAADQDKQDMFNMQHNMVGESVKLGQWEQANKHIKELFALAENSPEFRDFTFFAFYNQALVAYSQNKFVEAIESIEMALDLANTTNETYFVKILKAFQVVGYFRHGETEIAGKLAVDVLDQIGATKSLSELRKKVHLIHEFQSGNSKNALVLLWEVLDAAENTKQAFIKNSVALQSVTFDQRISKFQEQALADKLTINQLELEQQISQNNINRLKVLMVSLMALILLVITWFLFKSRKNYRRLSQTDYLTKISNRRHIINAGKQLLSSCEARKQAFNLVIIDIDNFKQINDLYGHINGDQVIKSVARTIQLGLTKNQKIGRIGGEEFVLLIPKLTSSRTLEQVEKIRKDVANQPMKLSGKTINIQISCGISQNQVAGEPLEDLLKRADLALYQAKMTGKNKSVVWQQEESKS